MDRLLRTFLGTSNLRSEGYGRALRGIRQKDRREMLFGLALTALSVVRDSGGRQKELIFRKEVPEGSAIVVHHKRRGDPKIEVIKP